MVAHLTFPQYPSFDCQNEGITIRWKKWITRLADNVFVAHQIVEDGQQNAMMLTLAGDELNGIFNSLPETDKTILADTDDTPIERAVSALTSHLINYNPRQNK